MDGRRAWEPGEQCREQSRPGAERLCCQLEHMQQRGCRQGAERALCTVAVDFAAAAAASAGAQQQGAGGALEGGRPVTMGGGAPAAAGTGQEQQPLAVRRAELVGDNKEQGQGPVQLRVLGVGGIKQGKRVSSAKLAPRQQAPGSGAGGPGGSQPPTEPPAPLPLRVQGTRCAVGPAFLQFMGRWAGSGWVGCLQSVSAPPPAGLA